MMCICLEKAKKWNAMALVEMLRTLSERSVL